MIKKLKLKLRRNKFVKRALKLMFKLSTLLPIKKGVVIFESFLGKQYSDNPRALYLYLKEHYPNYDLYWSINRNNVGEFNDLNIQVLPRFGLKWIWLMARAEYWVSNSRLPLWLPKRKGTTYIQTWHGTPLKRLATDMDEVHMPGTDTERYKKNFVKEAGKWDYLISPNRYSTEIFKRAFQFEKTIIESGYPRNDLLTSKNSALEISRIKEKLHLPQDKKVILYAPTWRDNEYYEVGKYKFSLKFDLEKMYERLGNDYIILLRLHYLVADSINIKQYENFIYNLSHYEDINELYLLADVLITDYSSVFFDYGVLDRPMLFYTYDIDSYRDELRGFYFDIEEVPGPLLYNTEEIIEALENLDAIKERYRESMTEFRKRFCYLEDGEASKRVIEQVFRNN